MKNIRILMMSLNKIPLLMHPLTWSHWLTLQLHFDWQPAPNPGYLHCWLHLNPVYPILQALNNHCVRNEMKNQKIRLEIIFYYMQMVWPLDQAHIFMLWNADSRNHLPTQIINYKWTWRRVLKLHYEVMSHIQIELRCKYSFLIILFSVSNRLVPRC